MAYKHKPVQIASSCSTLRIIVQGLLCQYCYFLHHASRACQVHCCLNHRKCVLDLTAVQVLGGTCVPFHCCGSSIRKSHSSLIPRGLICWVCRMTLIRSKAANFLFAAWQICIFISYPYILFSSLLPVLSQREGADKSSVF